MCASLLCWDRFSPAPGPTGCGDHEKGQHNLLTCRDSVEVAPLLPRVLHWQDRRGMQDFPFSAAPPIHRGLSPTTGAACVQEGPWPPSAGEFPCSGSLPSLPAQRPSPDSAMDFGCSQKCSGALTLRNTWLPACPGSPAWLPCLSPQSIHLRACRCQGLLQDPSWQAAAHTAVPQGFCFLLLGCWLLPLGLEEGEDSSLGVKQPHWFNLVFLAC